MCSQWFSPRFNPFRGPYLLWRAYFYAGSPGPRNPTSLSLYRAHRQLPSRAFDISHLALFGISAPGSGYWVWFWFGLVLACFGFRRISVFRFGSVALRYGRHFGFVIYGHVKRSPGWSSVCHAPTAPIFRLFFSQRSGLHLTCGCCVCGLSFSLFVLIF